MAIQLIKIIFNGIDVFLMEAILYFKNCFVSWDYGQDKMLIFGLRFLLLLNY